VIYCPVPPPPTQYTNAERIKIRNETKTRQDSVVIIQVSRMEEWKGHVLLINALGKLRAMPEWTCWIVGGAQRREETRYAQRLKEIATDLGVSERIRFLGERSDVPVLLASADIHCQPNFRPEPFGIAFIEALYSRLPVVTTSIGGAEEIVDDSCGILVPQGNEESLASSLKLLIKDPALRRQLGLRGPSRASELCDVTRQLKLLGEAFASISEGVAA